MPALQVQQTIVERDRTTVVLADTPDRLDARVWMIFETDTTGYEAPPVAKLHTEALVSALGHAPSWPISFQVG